MENNLKDQHYKNMGITPQMDTLAFEAESTAFWVAGMLGLDTSDYSFGYIAGWSKDRKVTELKDNLDLIKKTADKLVTDIDGYLEEHTEKKEEEKGEEVADPNVDVFFTVSECSEFHTMAGYQEGIRSAEEAKEIFESIPPEKQSFIPAIGIQLVDKTTGEEITQYDFIRGGRADFDMLQYYGEITGNQKAMGMLDELTASFPDIEIIGKGQEAAAAPRRHR